MSVSRVALETLAVALRDDLAHADRHVAELATWAVEVPVGHEVYAVAMLLHHLYTAIEAMLERALRTFDGAPPGGEDSHVRLLGQAALDVPGIRGVILPADEAVQELRRFRHRFRKRYDVALDPALLHPVVQNAVASWPRIRAYLAEFGEFVDECGRIAP